VRPAGAGTDGCGIHIGAGGVGRDGNRRSDIRCHVDSADSVPRIIMDAYLGPNMNLEEVRSNCIDRHIDPLHGFSEACRKELQIFGKC